MRFDDLDATMRVYETAQDHSVQPGIYMVARVDGRSFTTLTKEKCQFEAPFDVRFRDLMIETTKHLMNCGFKVTYAFTESDEISLLFDLQINTFGRKERKYNSILAGEASAKFSLLLQDHASFDCRICQLPRKDLVIDYFRWRTEDTRRNALNAHCYWMLRKEGLSKNQATAGIEHMSVAKKTELLSSRGVIFRNLPSWQKRGIGFYWVEEDRLGFNPKEQIEVATKRSAIKTDLELPTGDNHDSFLLRILEH